MTKIRTYPDGTIGFSQPDPELEAHLDRTYVRAPGGERRWVKVARGSTADLSDLRDAKAGRACVVLGKGPSLERVRELDFDESTVFIAINEAALSKLPPRIDYAIAVDRHVIDAIAGKTRPETVVLAPAAPDLPAGVTPLPAKFWDHGRRPNMGCSPAALRLASLLGAAQVTLVGFDGFDGPTAGQVYAPSLLRSGVADRGSGDFAVVNGAIAEELYAWQADAITFLHRIPKPKVPKGRRG